MRILMAAASMLTICSCATLTDRPSVDMVRDVLGTPKKVVSFQSPESADGIAERILQSDCGTGIVKTSGVANAGGNVYVPVSSSMSFSVDDGMFPDGRRWIALRGDGMVHALVSGIVLEPRPGGADVQVLVADVRQIDAIKASVQKGTLFCDWRKFDYPWD